MTHLLATPSAHEFMNPFSLVYRCHSSSSELPSPICTPSKGALHLHSPRVVQHSALRKGLKVDTPWASSFLISNHIIALLGMLFCTFSCRNSTQVPVKWGLSETIPGPTGCGSDFFLCPPMISSESAFEHRWLCPGLSP